MFIPNVQPPNPFYANSVERYHAPHVLLSEHRISVADYDGRFDDSIKLFELVNTLTNRHVQMDCVLAKFFLDADRLELAKLIESYNENLL